MSHELALYAAVSYGHNDELIAILNKTHVNVDVQNSQGYTPLMQACAKGYIDCVMTLLRHHANVNTRNADRETALMIAIQEDNQHMYNIVRMLIICGSSINAVNSRHETPIMIAAQRGLLELVQLFHHHHAAIFTQDTNRNTLMHHAALSGNHKLINFLISIDVSPNSLNRFGETPLSIAVERGHYKIIRTLLPHANDIFYDKNGDTLLHLAINMAESSNRKEIAMLFIEHSEFINRKNQKGQTPIMLACENNYLDLVNAILQRFPNTSIQDNNGNTCLSYALTNKNDEIVENLLNYEPSIIELKNNDWENALIQACRSTAYSVTLIAKTWFGTLDLSEANIYGNTALHIATLKDNSVIVTYLLEMGADPRILNNEGNDVLKIALDVAWNFDQYDIVKMLRRYFLKERVKLTTNVHDICAICLNEADQIQLQCGHVYHVICILDLIEHSKLECICPLCRKNILI